MLMLAYPPKLKAPSKLGRKTGRGGMIFVGLQGRHFLSPCTCPSPGNWSSRPKVISPKVVSPKTRAMWPKILVKLAQNAELCHPKV